MNAKQRAIEIYNEHLALASADGRNFRKTVMDQLMAETGCTLAAAATHYNNAKKNAAPIEGLGRPAAPKGIRKPGANKAGKEVLQEDNECFSVIELLKHHDTSITVGRCYAHLLQGDASEEFDERIKYKPHNAWVMIQGLGPLHGETFKLEKEEKEIKRYTPEMEATVAKELVDAQ
jgi:hypothetical protein